MLISTGEYDGVEPIDLRAGVLIEGCPGHVGRRLSRPLKHDTSRELQCLRARDEPKRVIPCRTKRKIDMWQSKVCFIAEMREGWQEWGLKRVLLAHGTYKIRIHLRATVEDSHAIRRPVLHRKTEVL